MAVVNLPDAPSNGTTQTVGGITYTYDSSKGYWTSSAGSSGSGGGASVSTSDSAPSSPSDGDLWYDTDDGGMFVYYADGSSNQWVEVIGQQGAAGAAGAAGADGSATVVANVTALLALSSPAAGDQAFVTATNTLYFYNGSGWYKIALINTNPSISGASAAYDLAADGTATTVTIVATDPEGLPITYSIASDTSGNIATVAQGTGASTNVWTITPSTNTAHAGTFSLTFRASDGVNIATAASSFTLQFILANSHYTTALITSVGANNATNKSTWDDKSSSNHTITANGDAHQTTFSPYRHGGYSTFFDGTGDYLTLGEQTSSAYGTSDFTIETWAYFTAGAAGSAYRYLFGQGSGTSGTNNLGLYIQGDVLKVWHNGAATITGTTTISLDNWYHIALVRNGSTLKLYLNGAEEGSVSNSSNITSTSAGISISRWSEISDPSYFAGYMRDFRIVKGTAVYTSAFNSSLPDTPLTAITNTSLLTCHLPYIADGSTDGHAITVAGDPTIEPISPYDYKEYDSSEHSGSIVFDGTGDYLSVPADASFAMGTGAFTWEFWLYLNSSTGASQNILDFRNGSAGLKIEYDNAGRIDVYSEPDSSTVITGSTTISLKIWYHVALTRDSSNNLRLFINGKQDGSTVANHTSNYTNNSGRIGCHYTNITQELDGILSDVRILKGSAEYTADFAPPTSPLTAITNTSLLLNGTDAGIIDKSQSVKEVSLDGGAKSSATHYKYLTSSMYFDGVDDKIRIPNISISAGHDFTIECWHYLTSRTDSYPALFGNYSSWGAGGLGLFADHSSYSGGYQLAHNGTFPAINAGTVNYNQWVHVAVVRSGTTITLYVDGSSIGTVSSSVALNGNGADFIIGRSSDNADGHIQGYLSDFRISKGLARYTSNFTAPTAALKG
ncbi:MAG: hypothetical protein CBC24_08670 [Candidatus Pelagibacter sp. TMED64]|nr:MAG: hypothetical protein CBC24_08670 [Candidatus Pelagibacter sp. TMED64]